MQTFLMWRSGRIAEEAERELQRVARGLVSDCGRLFADPPRVTAMRQAGCSIVYLEIPVEGFRTPHLQRDERDWALCLDFPADACELLEAEGGRPVEPSHCLPRLGRALAAEPDRLLERLAPPFVLISGGVDGGPIRVQNDGLGFGQILEYKSGDRWALTNRPYSLKALEITLRPVPLQWATRSVLGWFPLEQTGFEDLHVLEPATRLVIDEKGLAQSRHPVLDRWLAREDWSVEETLERAASAVERHLRAASRHWSRAVCGLTGGLDSRAVAAAIIGCGIRIDHLRTHGLPSNREVIIARHLAKLSTLPHRVEQNRALPPGRPALLRKSIEDALRWQCGLMEVKAHKSFNLDGKRLGGGRVNIMGKHGEIGRGYYQRRAGPAGRGNGSAADWEERLLAHLTQPSLSLLRPELREPVLQDLRRAIGRAGEYGLVGRDQLDFFYLNERTRRWAAGTIHSQPGKVITPFLDPGYIQAAFNLEAASRAASPFQRHIVSRNMPAWSAIPYLSDSAAKEWCKQHTSRWRREWWRLAGGARRFFDRRLGKYLDSSGHRYAFDNTRYWSSVGQALVEEALSRGELLNQVFQREKVRVTRPREPDLLAVLLLVEQVL